MIDRLIKAIIDKRNPSVLGLDTCMEYLPGNIYDLSGENSLESVAGQIFDFNKRLIDATYDIIPAVKLQLAYYELYSYHGLACLHKTAQYAASKGMVVIADGKRNDIGATAQAYSKAYLGRTALGALRSERAFDCDFLTVNPYLGFDGIKPFLEDAIRYDKGIFVLVKTSNPSGGQFQDLKLENGKTLYEQVGQYVLEWGLNCMGDYGYSDVGAVVGATYPEQCTQLRAELGTVFFLIPGYGAQGAGAEQLIGGFDENGLGAVVNASRSLMCAYKKNPDVDFAAAARLEAISMRDAIVGALKKNNKINY